MKKKKGVAILFIVLIIFSFQGNIFGAINTTYQNGQTVVEDDLEKKSGDSVILNVLAPFVYWIASTVENLVGKAFKGLTGSEMFPWADRILFNTLPMLDVNIFNPAPNSLFKTGGENSQVTPLAKIVRNTYFTVLTISVAFLTIVVGIAATKLALSSIASEKAKYKEAVTKWMFSIILIFLMHNVISFIFWINEQMVEVASGLVDEAVLKGNLGLLQEALSLSDAEIVKLFTEANKSNLSFITSDEVDFVKANGELGAIFLNDDVYIDTMLFDALGEKSAGKELFTGNGKDSLRAMIRDMKIIKGEKNTYSYSEGSNSHDGAASFAYSIQDICIEDFIEVNDKLSTLNFDKITDLWETDFWGGSSFKDGVDPIVGKVAVYRAYQIQNMKLGDGKQEKISNFKRYVKSMVSIYNKYNSSINNNNNNINSNSNSNSNSTGTDVIAGLGNYFKRAAYTLPTDESGKAVSWKRSKLTITGAILYAIFVFQSIFYFLAYLKRFFYIIILVIMAPIIVLLDFLRKAIV